VVLPAKGTVRRFGLDPRTAASCGRGIPPSPGRTSNTVRDTGKTVW
jgi:hypothetical protein